MNEAAIDALANGLLGFGSFDTTSTPRPLATSALLGDRVALRRLVKNAIREARDLMNEVEAHS